ncbi:unnamed protein product [Pleuronectes platessa]|uniref:Uncharacterized protein n=1 Tax=Pleuronectes platessa TaxID=8262 RepID=A0A9N7Z3V0_PLEPL|nr:unnamed protein product [Pleuronectes platessa]
MCACSAPPSFCLDISCSLLLSCSFSLSLRTSDEQRIRCIMLFFAIVAGLGAVTLLVLLFASHIRSYAAGGVCRSPARLDGKTALITGAKHGHWEGDRPGSGDER